MSVFSIERFGRPSRPAGPVSVPLWFTNSPHGQRSSAANGVTQSVCPMTCARSSTGDAGSIIAGRAAPGHQLVGDGVPTWLVRAGLVTFHARCVPQS